MRDCSRQGFTLLEVTLVLGILTLLLGFTLSISVGALGRSSLGSAENVLIQTTRRAQSLSQNNIGDGVVPGGKIWGVYICQGTTPSPAGCTGASPAVVLFRRDPLVPPLIPPFDAYATATDQKFEINPRITFSGDLYAKMIEGTRKGLVFTQLKAEPADPTWWTTPGFKGAITMTLDGETRTVTVNPKGVIER